MVHGDYRLDNLIVAKDAPKIIAVLDWELSTLGDPLADFSYHLMAWHMPPFRKRGRHRIARRPRSCRARHSIDGRLRRSLCRAHRARSAPYLPVYLAYNFFRIAAILQGIIGRVRDGTATSEFAPAKAEMIRPLARTAWDFAKQA